jgi:hydrogenase nickel incorporation protein HypB
MMQIKLMDKVLAANDAWAAENRAWLAQHGIAMLNLIGSPGAGKTSLLERTIATLKAHLRMAVIEGDIATTKDAERIACTGVPVYQINTGTACHLDAHLVNAALKDVCQGGGLDLVLVENIGNLVCPAEFDIGEHAKIAVLSVTEGDDKIEKYPLLFTEARAMVITKAALLGYTNFRLDYVRQAFRRLNQPAEVFFVDSLTGEGFKAWLAFVGGFAARCNGR